MNGADRREYERVDISADGLLYIEDIKTADRELSGTVEDISEKGFKISIDSLKYSHLLPHLKVDDNFDFTFVDEYDFFGTTKNAMLSGSAKVVRRAEQNGNLILGCYLIQPSRALLQYVSDKKVLKFMGVLNFRTTHQSIYA